MCSMPDGMFKYVSKMVLVLFELTVHYIAVMRSLLVICGCHGDRVSDEESSEPHRVSSNTSSNNHGSRGQAHQVLW